MNLTREQILSEPAGRTLDAWVAEYVMGYSVYHYDKDHEANCYYMLMDENFNSVKIFGEAETEQEAWNDCDLYSTDIVAAFEMEEKMLEPDTHDDYGFELYLITGADETRAGISNLNVCKIAHASPEQRCKAALLTLLEG